MATSQVSEQELPFRKRARRRLVGAIALVLLMVTVLPMVLDDREVRAPRQDIAISIPSQEGGNFTSRIVPVAPQAAPVTPPAVQLASPLQPPKPAAAPEPKAPAAAARPEPSAPVPVTQSEAPTAKPEEPAASAAATRPAPVKSAVAEKPANKKGSFSVQIGVFAESPKLKQLEDKLVAKGFRPAREKLDTPKGIKIRLRIGPFATRSDAEVALEKLKSADVVGMIVSNSK